MVIKKFQGRTEADALEEAKKELGEGLVVMSSRKVNKKGFLSLFKKSVIEVTVALEDEPARMAAMNMKKSSPQDPARTPLSAAWQKQADAASEKSSAQMNVIGEKLDSLQSLLEQQFQKRGDAAEEEPEQEEEEGNTPQETAEEKNAETMKFMKLLYGIMIDNEISEKYINEVMDETEKGQKPNMPFDYALANIYQKMILKFGAAAEIAPAEKGPKVVIFIGPTGVGKTTTIAKIASKFCVEEKKKVGLLTADTYRIAATDQLRTYANILEVPFRIIYTAEEMKEAITDFKDYDYLFVDTAGHSHNNESQREAMKLLINSVDEVAQKEVFLVLSATTKYRDLTEIADSYKKITKYRLIFTKLDETKSLGNLYNLHLYTGEELAYVTCGQNVPDDIEKFNPQKTVKKLLERH